MSRATVNLTARYDRPNGGFCGCSLDPDPAARNWFYLRETVDVLVTVYYGDEVLDLTGVTAARIKAKPYDDWAGDVLFESENLESTADQLTNGILAFGDVNLNTVELVAEMSTDQSKPVTLSVIELDGISEDRLIVQGNVSVVADVDRSDDGSPST